MWILLVSLFCSSSVASEQITSSTVDGGCDPNTSSWTRWYNTQDPQTNNNGNDIEDISSIRNLYSDAVRCTSVSNMEYAIQGQSQSQTTFYQTLINNNGVSCMGTPTSRCPDYSVRFCCPLEQTSLSSECGKTFRQPNFNSALRIVNGFEAIPHSLPWAVSLEYNGVHDCGGVIIDQWHILTAAHCLDYSDDLGNYYARIGAHNRLTSGQLMPIAELIIHPTYNEAHSTDDIGIVRLAAPITFTEEIQPICLEDNVCSKGFIYSLT